MPKSQAMEGFVNKGGVERDGQYLVIKGEKAKEADAQVTKWLRKIGMLNPEN